MTDKNIDTEPKSNTAREEEITGRRLRPNAAPLDRYRSQIQSWLNEEKRTDQQCCDRLKRQFNLECSPKLIAVHRRHWALEEELDASANHIHKTLEFTAQALAGLEPAAGMMSQAIPMILESRFINAAMNPATTDQALERLARMIQLFRRMALKQEELDLRRMVEKNKLAMYESAQRSRTTHVEPDTSVPPYTSTARPASAPAFASVPFDTFPKSARPPQVNPTLAEALAKTCPEVVTGNYR